jgi:hypothetical protein
MGRADLSSLERGEASGPLGCRAGLAAGGLVFLLLTLAVFWYQFRAVSGGSAFAWDRLRWGYLLLVLLCLPMETLTAAVRTLVVSRTMQPGPSLWTCVKAEWANVALNMLTPCHAGGGPAQVYMLSRAGVRIGTALTISLMSFAGTILGVLSVSLYVLLVSDAGRLRALSVTSVAVLGAIAALMTLAAWRPGAFRIVLGSGRLLALVSTYRDEVRRVLHAGAPTLVWIYVLSLVFLFARGLIAYLCVRFLGVDAGSFREIVEIQLSMAFLVLFAPTPGGAGVAEGASLALMADIVPAAIAPYYNVLWRLSTTYLAAMAGLVCVSRALLEDGRRMVRARRRLRPVWSPPERRAS